MGTTRKASVAMVGILLAVSIAACSASPAIPTPVVIVAPSPTPAPTDTPAPTMAPEPTETPLIIRYLAEASPTPMPKNTSPSTGAGATTMQVKAILPLKYVDFQADSAILTEKAKEDIKKQVLPTLLAEEGTFLRIEGRAAKPPQDTDEACLKLSIERANAVKDYLVSLGVPPERLIARGVGATKAKFRNSTVEEELRQDRIIEFAIVVPMG